MAFTTKDHGRAQSHRLIFSSKPKADSSLPGGSFNYIYNIDRLRWNLLKILVVDSLKLQTGG